MRILIGLAALIGIIAGVYYVVEEQNDGPLENAAEEIDDVVDELEN